MGYVKNHTALLTDIYTYIYIYMRVCGGGGCCQEPYTLDFIILHVINLNIYFIRV